MSGCAIDNREPFGFLRPLNPPITNLEENPVPVAQFRVSPNPWYQHAAKSGFHHELRNDLTELEVDWPDPAFDSGALRHVEGAANEFADVP